MSNQPRRLPARERAQIAFGLYIQLRPRSIARLHEQLAAIGVRISLATLKRYSTRFHWQKQVDELEEEAARGQREVGVAHLVAMQDRHAQLARAVQGAGGSALAKLVSSDQRLDDMRPGEIARLLELGLRAERRAVGEATDRRDIAVGIWNSVTVEMVGLFGQVQDEPDPDA